MKIKYLQVQPDILDNIDFDTNKHIQVLRGYFAHIMLGLVQMSTLRYDETDVMSRLFFDDECLVHCGVEIGDETYNVTHRCFIGEDGQVGYSMGASKSKTYCEDDIATYIKSIGEVDTCGSVFSVNFDDNPKGLGASDLALEQLNSYIDKMAQKKSNRQAPVFIGGCLEHLDDSVDIKAIFDRLGKIGSQVFMVAPDKYPVCKLAHKDVAVTNCHNELYSRIYLERS